MKFNEGFNSNISEKSNNISGGEKQKMALSRVFLKNSQVIILDEPTSALDITSTNILKNILEEVKKNKIIIIV